MKAIMQQLYKEFSQYAAFYLMLGVCCPALYAIFLLLDVPE